LGRCKSKANGHSGKNEFRVKGLGFRVWEGAKSKVKQSKAKQRDIQAKTSRQVGVGRKAGTSFDCLLSCEGGHAVLFAMGGWRDVIDQPLASKVGHVVRKNSVLWLLPIVVQDAVNQCGAR